MNDLTNLKKRLFPVVIEYTFLVIALILLLPTLIKPFIEKTPIKSYYSSRMNNRALIGAPLILYWWIFHMKRFIGVLIDEKYGEKKSVIVKSSRNRKKSADLIPVFLPSKKSNNTFSYWKAKISKHINYKFIVPNTIKGPKGNADNYYLITYYKHSKLITEIKGPLNPKKVSIVSGRYINETNQGTKDQSGDGSVIDSK